MNLLLLAWIAGALAAGPARTIVVETGGAVATVGRALELAGDGDTIVVRAGQYREPPLVVNRRVVLLGEPGAVLDGGGTHQILTIKADSVVVRGFTLAHVGTSYVDDRAAIRADSVRGCVIERNQVLDAFFGIYLAHTADCVVRHNLVRGSARNESSAGNAIHLWYSTGTVVDSNQVNGHRDGIYLEFSGGSVIRGNQSTGNRRYGLHFMFSNDCRYEGNTFSRNGAGVAVMYSQTVTMVGNRFTWNRGPAAYGLLLKEIHDSRVEGNEFLGNTVALHLDGADRVRISHNLFEQNGWAIRLLGSTEGDTLTGNGFRGNSFDLTTNTAHAAGAVSGNYWDQYAGYDLDRDGRGDVPFHPVRLFSMLVQDHQPGLILLRSFVVDLLDLAERMLPVLTPEALVDPHPLMQWPG
ncbi:MAG TPA: nitrous oxide reductase family maturation protein NosD [Gemmatimonadales bacterium]|nr:nitrous oxide reductase family maturation protein NosD [Gemmatimonadales bacterium]